VGSVSAPQTVVGSLSLEISGISIVGVNLLEFGIVPSGTTCPVLGGSLLPNTSCNLAVDFAPLSAGDKSAQVAIADNAPGSPQAVALTGIAGSSAISLVPASLTFASQTVGTSSAPQNVTLSNRAPLSWPFPASPSPAPT
jgi:trimeric autotransporter adhesin